jgi:hypothetical protein
MKLSKLIDKFAAVQRAIARDPCEGSPNSPSGHFRRARAAYARRLKAEIMNRARVVAPE